MRQAGAGAATVSSRVLLLEALWPAHRADGSVAPLPGREELLVLPVTATGVAHVPLLKALAEKNFQTAPYPITDQVFWLHGGVWRPFPIEIRGDRVTLQPPAEFTAALPLLVPENDVADHTRP